MRTVALLALSTVVSCGAPRVSDSPVSATVVPATSPPAALSASASAVPAAALSAAAPRPVPRRVQGTIEQQAVQRVVRDEGAPKYRACYDVAVSSDAKLEGSVELQFTIAEDGTAVDVLVVPSASMKSDTLAACLASVTRSLGFPKPDGGVVYIHYPLEFERNAKR